MKPPSSYLPNQIRRIPFWAGLVAVASLWLTGCADEYSANVAFKVRTDPVFKEKPNTLGLEVYDPDTPNQLPLRTLKAIFKPANPYYAVRDKVKAFDPANLTDAQRDQFRQGLDALFGTPQAPFVDAKIIEPAQRQALELDSGSLARGSLLFRAQCLTCHGLTGDGRGPTAPWVNPHPRDYRLGRFKFQSVDQTQGAEYKPLREDLKRTLYTGVEGTSMPAFNLLSDENLEDLVSYVIFLSIRGEAEYQTMLSGMVADNDKGFVLSDEKFKRGGIAGRLAIYAKAAVGAWADSQDQPIVAQPYPFASATDQEMKASVQRGYAMFIADPARLKQAFDKEKFKKDYARYFPKKDVKGKMVADFDNYDKALENFANSVSCVKCHTDFGRRAKFSFDEWGTMIRPANLTLGVYRGGRRPIDLYWRTHSGINGSGMAGFGNIVEGEQLWDLVNFVRALPFPAMREQYGIEVE